MQFRPWFLLKSCLLEDIFSSYGSINLSCYTLLQLNNDIVILIAIIFTGWETWPIISPMKYYLTERDIQASLVMVSKLFQVRMVVYHIKFIIYKVSDFFWIQSGRKWTAVNGNQDQRKQLLRVRSQAPLTLLMVLANNNNKKQKKTQTYNVIFP